MFLLTVIVVGVSVAVVLSRFSVTPSSTPLTVLVLLVPAMPLILKVALLAACPPSAVACERLLAVVPVGSKSKPVPSVVSPFSCMTLARPVWPLVSTNCLPAVPLMMVAVTRPSVAALLMASRTCSSVLPAAMEMLSVLLESAAYV